MGFIDYRNKVLKENAISSKIAKNAIDLVNDYIYSIEAELSEDERKQIVQNMRITIDTQSGDYVRMTGIGQFIQNGKYNKQANFSIELKFGGITDEGVTPDTPEVIDNPEDTAEVDAEVPEEETPEEDLK